MLRLEKRRIIRKFLRGRTTTPLTFKFSKEYDGFKTALKMEKADIETGVLTILSLSKALKSVNSSGKLETMHDRWRSSLDIWRHYKFYEPEITIFDVMEAIHATRYELLTLYCMGIYRRVFRIRRHETFRMEIYGRTHLDYKDEYGLKFIQWKGLNIIKK
jgi:hypothetical protein